MGREGWNNGRNLAGSVSREGEFGEDSANREGEFSGVE